MTSPSFGGHLGDLILTGWVAPAPTGRDEAYLLLTTPDGRAGQTMPLVADALGVGTTPGAPSGAPQVHVTIDDGWITLHLPGGEHLTRPGGGEWCATATTTGRVVLVIGCAPMPAGMHPDTYTTHHGATTRIALVPLR